MGGADVKLCNQQIMQKNKHFMYFKVFICNFVIFMFSNCYLSCSDMKAVVFILGHYCERNDFTIKTGENGDSGKNDVTLHSSFCFLIPVHCMCMYEHAE